MYGGGLTPDVVFNLLVRETTFACRYLDAGELPFTDELVDGLRYRRPGTEPHQKQSKALACSEPSFGLSVVALWTLFTYFAQYFRVGPVLLPTKAGNRTLQLGHMIPLRYESPRQPDTELMYWTQVSHQHAARVITVVSSSYSPSSSVVLESGSTGKVNSANQLSSVTATLGSERHIPHLSDEPVASPSGSP